MHIRGTILGALCGILLLTGCGATETAGDSTPTKAAAATSSPSKHAPEVHHATTRQYASIVASSSRDIRDSLRKTKREGCVFGGFPPIGPPVCAVYALTLGLRASTLAMKLEGAMKPQGRAFIGEPPAEIALLLHDTIATAKKVTRTQERLPAKCITETRINRCTRLGFHFYEATKDLQEALDAWEPYL